MPHDAFDQVVAHVVALAHPDHPVFFRHRQDETAPTAPVHHHVGKTWHPRRLPQLRGTGRVHQQPVVVGPHLEGQLALVAVPHLVVPGLAQGLVEGTVQLVTALLLHRQAHDALQQPGVLRQVGVVHLVNFVAAVVVVVQRQQPAADQQQQHHPPQGALAQRAHALRSTR
ncbi:hypothetical protein D3C75_985240 [compost metagenome]